MRRLRSPGLDGLRGIAVAAVVVEHAWPNLLPGGFTGVDMFFVLSGFLITNQLLSEYQQNGRISLGAFYARRIKRIFPASLLVILATGITWALLFGPGLANEILRSLAAATASISNFYFMASSLDYFQADSGSSPVLHYWSLAVEEQFYLAYPVLLLLIARIARWRNSADSFPRLVGLTLTVATVLSFLAMTFSSPTAAFYLPWFRAWELSAGGLIAVFVASQGEAARRIAPHVRSALLAMGSIGLITAFVYSETFTRWPGYETAIPVVATCLLVISLFNAPKSSVFFASAPLVFLGRISFALYLWHWVLLGLFDNLSLPGLRSDAFTLLAVSAALALATASTVIVEEPIRSIKIETSRGTRKAIAAGFLSVAVTLGLISTGVPTLAKMAGFGTPLAASLAEVRDDFTRLRDEPGYFTVTGEYRSSYSPCAYGAAQSQDLQPLCASTPLPKIVLLGDSHALAWFPAINSWASENGYALIVLGRSACSPFNIQAVPTEAASNCTRWANEVWGRIEAISPDLLVVATSRFSKISVNGALVAPASGSSAWMNVAITQLAEVRSKGVQVLLVGEVPRASFNIPDCLALRRLAPVACELPVAEALPAILSENQIGVAASAGINYWNPSEKICPDGVCTWISDNRVMFIDAGHLSATYAMSLKESLGVVLGSMVSARTP